MKLLFKLLIILVALVGIAYFFNDKIPKHIKEKAPIINQIPDIVDSVIDADETPSTPEEKIEPTLVINTDADNNLAMMSVNENGVGVSVYTTGSNTGEVVDYFIIETKDSSPINISVNEKGVVKELKTDGYTLSYSNYTGAAIDLTVTHPNGTTETTNGISIGQPVVSWIPTAHATAAAMTPKITIQPIKKMNTRTDHLDGKYYTDTAGTVWNGIICAGGILTDIIPNPVSTAAAIVGCGTLIARVTPANIAVDDCGDKSVFDCVTGLIDLSGDTTSYLHGTISSNDGEHLLPDVQMNISHKSGKSMQVVSGEYGIYGSGGIPLDLNGTYTMKISKEEFAPRTFTMVVSDNKIKIVDSEGSVMYDYEKKSGDMPPFNFSLTLNSEYKANFSTRDPLNLGDNYYADLTGSIIITVDDGLFECEWSASGNINYKDDTTIIKGPVNAKSSSCSGEAKDGKLRLTGKINGEEPYPDGIAEAITAGGDVSMMEGLMGPIQNMDFRIDGEYTEEGISGMILVPRLSFQSPVHHNKVDGIKFMAIVE